MGYSDLAVNFSSAETDTVFVLLSVPAHPVTILLIQLTQLKPLIFCLMQDGYLKALLGGVVVGWVRAKECGAAGLKVPIPWEMAHSCADLKPVDSFL